MWKSAAWVVVMASLAGCGEKANPPTATPKGPAASAQTPTPKAPEAGAPAGTAAAESPITLKEFGAISGRTPLQGADAERQAFAQEVETLGASLKGRSISDQAVFTMVNEAPHASGQPRAYDVLCGPAENPAVRLGALVHTTEGNALNMTAGQNIRFSGKVEGARYDRASEMVLVLVGEGTMQ